MFKGIYILVISIRESILIQVGSLGKLKFSQGIYAYVGSAQNGIEKRLERHFGHSKKKFWHIDYLLNNSGTSIDKVLYKEASKDEECKTAILLAKYGMPIKGFGCSDCRCKSHLFKLKRNFLNNIISDQGFHRLTKIK
ncbi:GIY-YIG nuclease family protein [candidate division WOR-3 bacterium]|nr:GIY-YIG nuclease family protein [candidate division WOR-3 bacterium]